MRRRWTIALLVAGLLALGGCAAGPGSRWADPTSPAAGFFPGLWHGALLVVSLVVSFFSNDVRVYELHNTGAAYDIGFVLGILAVYGSGTHVTIRRRRRPRDRELGDKIDREIRRRVAKLLDDDPNWEELGEKIKQKVKEKLRRWMDEDAEK